MSNIAGKAYGMNVITPVPPSVSWLQRLIFMVARAVPSTLSGLLGLSLIHFARWVIIRRDQWPAGDQGKPDLKYDYVLFCSNFNGTWDQYIDAFSDGIPKGLDLFWYASFKYPHSIPITAFKDYIVHNQFDIQYYYNATPGSGQRDIKAALRVYAELQSLDARHPKMADAEFATEYKKSMARIQNSLGSPGYAPIASLDTERAEDNRLNFLTALKGAGPTRNVPRPAGATPAAAAPTTTFDGGHCFLTVLLPINTEAIVFQGSAPSSHVHALRDALSILPTAHQSKPTERQAANSPFTQCEGTHFARLAIIDDVIFNGAPPSDAILASVKTLISNTSGTADYQPDELPGPYLLFSVDCDAGSEQALRTYLRNMWNAIGSDLLPILSHCFDFDETVGDADDFAEYLCKHRVETTMPFNDYWTVTPPLPSLSLVVIGLTFAVATLVVGAAIYFGFDLLGLFWTDRPLPVRAAAVAVLTVTGLAAGIYAAYRLVMSRGRQPFPQAPNSDLRSVLKALYLQRELIDFAIKHQGVAPAALYTGFGDFLRQVAIDNLQTPTQPPGVI
jgi:hypothetical protein